MKKTDMIPKELIHFLTVIISGKSGEATAKVNRLVSSIGQDICRGGTNGIWKLPKHIGLCVSLRHLFRSKELITLMNRFGHCENYAFALEMETAIATAVQMKENLLSQKIIRNPKGMSVFHSEFDNFDQFVNNISGSGSIHTAQGIMLQDFSVDQDQETQSLPAIHKGKKRSLSVTEQEELEDCYVVQRKSPKLLIVRDSLPGAESANNASLRRDVAWLTIRLLDKENCNIPGWAGFVSLT